MHDIKKPFHSRVTKKQNKTKTKTILQKNKNKNILLLVDRPVKYGQLVRFFFFFLGQNYSKISPNLQKSDDFLQNISHKFQTYFQSLDFRQNWLIFTWF